MNYEIKLATIKSVEDILNLYHSLIGSDGCTWDWNYPSIDNVKNDIKNKSLYIVLNNKEIIAAITASKDDELSEVSCFNKEMNAPCDLARLAVKKEYQNQGIAKYLLSYIESDVLKRGCDGICFLVSKTNPHAKAVYDKMNYTCCGECYMFDENWYCYEKKLKEINK